MPNDITNSGTSVVRVGLLSCAKLKKVSVDKAKNLYISQNFRKAREYVERCYDRWYILSSKYHLLDPETEIEYYDESLNTKSASEIRKWSEVTFSQIQQKMPDPRSCTFFIHAGGKYRTHLVALLRSAGYECHVPLQKLSIGKQMAWYNTYNKEKRCHF